MVNGGYAGEEHQFRLSGESAASRVSYALEDTAQEDAEDDDRIEAETTVTPALIRIAVVAGLGALLFGYDTGVVSGALLVIGSELGGKTLTRGQESFLVSSALFGACAGSLIAGKGADRFGRKPIILAAAVLFTLGALEQAAAQVYKEVILGRVLVGIGVGLASSVLPMYLAEVSPAKYRGRIVASLVVLITAGQVLSYLVDAAFFNVSSGWRWMFGSGAIPAIAQLVLSFQLPESPRWLILHDRIAPARRTLRSVYPLSDGDAIQRRIERIQREVQDEEAVGILGIGEIGDLRKAKESLVAKLWSQRRARRATILACGLQGFQQATGFNALMYFSGKILQAAHFGQPAAFSLVVAVSNFVCTILALRLIDRLGRRPLLLRTLVGMFLGMLLLGISFFFIPSIQDSEGVSASAPRGPNAWAFVALFGMVVFCSSYALGLGNVPWVLQSEVFTQDVRATATSLATATNWIANLVVASTFLHLAQGLSIGGVFLAFAVITIAAFLFTYRFLPETKGLALEETQALFDGDVWNASKPAKSSHSSSMRPRSATYSALETGDTMPEEH